MLLNYNHFYFQIGAIEGQFFLKTGKLVSISEQNLIDCAHNDGNFGCRGGDMVPAFKFIHNNDGIDSEASYPYVARPYECNYTVENNVTSAKGYGVIKEGTCLITIKYYQILLEI